MRPALLYLQIPFCPARCSFCRCVSAIPNRVLLNRGLHEQYVAALIRDIRHHVPRLAERYRPIGINWGGGTPTVLRPDQLHAVAAAFRPEWDLAAGYFSVEATADSLSDEVLTAMREIGVNRLSIGVESFNDGTLRRMARRHTAAEGLDAVERARRLGFPHLSVDLVIGYPGESVEETVHSVEVAASLGLPHLAAHLYSPVENSSLVRSLRRDPAPIWDSGTYARGMAEVAAAMAAAGYRNSEYFHWTRPPHDADYVSLDVYFGHSADMVAFGAGAHSFVAPQGCLTALEMPGYLADPAARQPGPVTLELSLEKALGCRYGLQYPAMAAMYGVAEDTVRRHPISRALAELPGIEIGPDGLRIRREEWVRQYVQGVRRRMDLLCRVPG